ncbi:serine hydrolase domain-containing protein [Polyangium sp. 15x6]|uniref:serine hydrolase domain-containing protein n=1 Tax=Polyangium sp. 15x6 TaxID=3042687 RepID=UPI00249BE5B6|nr:serine hydrolase domain-containing protein [Polyangium sp. 15x6]MDI3288716.1 serine hydrolase domain-containing protein [Polyangium sp. 15x6]
MNRRDLLVSVGAGAGWLIAGAALGGCRARPREPASKAAVDPPPVLESWLERWLAAFNDPDLGVYKRFVETLAPTVRPYVDDDLAVREITGGFELLSSQVTGPQEITAWVKDHAWDRRSKVVLTASGPDKLDDIAFAGAPAEGTIQRLDQASALAAVKTKLGEAARAGRFNGAVLIARGEQVLFSAGHGSANDERALPVTTSTRFCIGSMGKVFTAVAIMQLVEQGRLGLSDPLARHLPDYANRSLAERVTVEQLLTHTGGTGDIFGPQYDANAGALETTADLVRFYGAREPLFEPGSRWGYSNYGFVLLGAILERVTGKPYEAVFHERIFGPAGMPATSQAFASSRATAMPYTGAGATGRKALAPYEGLPAGGGYSTVEDLQAFVVALRRGALVSAATLAAMTAPRVVAGTSHWGLGLAVRTRNGETYYGHGGSAPGVNGDLAIYRDYATVVLCNRGHPAALTAAEFIGARLPVG